MSDDERAELVPSGAHTRLYDRVSWARSYLGKAGMVEGTKRGVVRISDRGRAVLADKPDRVDLSLLAPYLAASLSNEPAVVGAPIGSDETPLEAMDMAYRTFRADLAEGVLSQIRTMTPAFFERLVVDLMLKLGYGGTGGNGTVTRLSGDGGVDGIISEDKLGLESICLQAKRYEDGVVGRPAVQAFIGSLEGRRTKKGVFITTSRFSNDARSYVRSIEKSVVLIDGQELAELMIDAGLGVVVEKSYAIPRLDADYFVES